MKRREFIAALGGAAAWPLVARAQLLDRGPRRVGLIMAAGKTPEYVAARAAFEQALESFGWKQGFNLRVDERWSAAGQEQARAVKEIVALNPDVIVGQSAAWFRAR
jgi:putative ABC transport system substrate-binding protein